MSKKMLKRSLALGALMAFVITGQAWAEAVNITDNTTVESIEVSNGELISGIETVNNRYAALNVQGVKFDVSGDVNIESANSGGQRLYGIAVQNGSVVEVKGTTTVNVTGSETDVRGVRINSSGGDTKLTFNDLNVTATNTNGFVAAIDNWQKGELTINGNANVKAVQNTGEHQYAIAIQSGGKTIFNGATTTLVAESKNGGGAQGIAFDDKNCELAEVIFNSDTTAINATSNYSAIGIAGTEEGKVTFEKGNVEIKVVNNYANGASVSAVGISAGVWAKETVEEVKVSVEGSGIDDGNTNHGDGTAAIYGTNSESMTFESKRLVVDVKASEKEHTSNTYGIRASNGGEVIINSDVIDIDVTDKVANAYGVRANCNDLLRVHSTSGNPIDDEENETNDPKKYTYKQKAGTINLGSENSVITIDATAENGYAVGIAAHRSNDVNKENASAVTVNGKSLVINATGKTAYGVLGMNNTTGTATKVSTVTINSADTTINAKSGLVALSQSKINVNGNLTVNSEGGDAIVSRGGATVNINTEGKDRVVKLTGDIDFNYNQATSGSKIDAAVNLNLTNANSFFTGKIYKSGDTTIPDGKDSVTGMNINLSNGAKWNLTGESIVTNATFGKDSVLNIKGADFDASQKTVYALNASEGTPSLKVEQGAKLAIEGVEENVTYNIANGFGVKKEVGENWTIDNNLLTGDWTDTNGLQVTTRAKEAGEIVADMGVESGTGDALAGIIEAVNDIPATNEAQNNVIAFAEEIAKASPEVAAAAAEAVVKMAEAGGNSATAASIVKNVTGVTNDRLSFNCGHSAPHKGGHGVGLFEEGSGADVWVEYVHGKDEVEGMKSTAGATSYEGQYNGIVMGVDFKKVNKFQSGIAFNYGEGDTNSVGTSARTHSDYDFWGIGYYGNIHNDDSNIIFDINYAKSDSDVTNNSVGGLTYEASPETTTWTAGVKVEKLYQNNNVQIVPYTGLRYMSIDSDDYATKCGTFNYKMERQDIWLLPVGVSIRQEIENDNGWTVSPRVDLSYIWAFGDTDSNMEFATALNTKTNIGYDVMDDGSFLGLVGIEAHKGQWGYGVSYSYQKGDHSESKKWYVDVNYSF